MVKTNRVPITANIIDHLQSEKVRTGVGVQKLFRGTNATRPKGLTSSSIVHNWLNGKSKTAEQAHIEWVFNAYRDFGTSRQQGTTSRIKIGDEQHQVLMNECERTRLGAVRILRHALSNLPEGLNHQKVQSWIDRSSKSAKTEHWEFVMKLYAAISTRKQIASPKLVQILCIIYSWLIFITHNQLIRENKKIRMGKWQLARSQQSIYGMQELQHI